MRSVMTYVGCLALFERSQRVFAPSLTLMVGFKKPVRERGASYFNESKGAFTISLCAKDCERGRRCV